MDSILQGLYHGMIHPEEEYQPTEEIRQKRQELDSLQQNLLKRLKMIDPELSREMNELLEAENRADALEMEEIYIQGMHMGATLALALLDKQAKKDRPSLT